MLRLLSWINVVLICCVIALAFVIKDTREEVEKAHMDHLRFKIDLRTTLYDTFRYTLIEDIRADVDGMVYMEHRFQCSWDEFIYRVGDDRKKMCYQPSNNPSF